MKIKFLNKRYFQESISFRKCNDIESHHFDLVDIEMMKDSGRKIRIISNIILCNVVCVFWSFVAMRLVSGTIQNTLLLQIPIWLLLINMTAMFRQLRRQNYLVISHVWENADDPDPRRVQFINLQRKVLDVKSTTGSIFYDYSCIKQHPRSMEEEVEFKESLVEMNHMYKNMRVEIIKNPDYFNRGWCVFEWLCTRENLYKNVLPLSFVSWFLTIGASIILRKYKIRSLILYVACFPLNVITTMLHVFIVVFGDVPKFKKIDLNNIKFTNGGDSVVLNEFR